MRYEFGTRNASRECLECTEFSVRSRAGDDAPIDIEALGQEKSYGFNEHFGFELLAGGDYFLQAHLRADRKTPLRNDRPFIEMHGHKMCGHAENFDASLVALPVSLRAGEARQQRGMNVDDLVFVAPDKVRRQNLHKAGQDEEVDLVFVQKL